MITIFDRKVGLEMLSYFILGAGLIFTYFIYRFFESREKVFINAFVSPYGPFVDAVNLDFFQVAGKDRLKWGSKLYLYNKGIVIGNPLGGTNNLFISLKDVKCLANKGKGLVFYHKPEGAYQPVKFELFANPLQKSLPSMISQVVIENENY